MVAGIVSLIEIDQADDASVEFNNRCCSGGCADCASCAECANCDHPDLPR